jgi:sigma-B regulation protein RsbU (phosphoserine phosphatase)
MHDVHQSPAGTSALHTLMCSEIWGANSNVAHSVELPGLQSWVYSAPIELGQNGGDIHYLSVCDEGVLCRVALADVSGHGRAVSAVAERLLGLMRSHINRVEQREFLHELSGALHTITAEAVTFATALVIGFDSSSGRLVFTNAGHPPPLWYRADKGRWDWLRQTTADTASVTTGLPLGMDFFENAYTDIVVELGAGDLLICYTDGLSEAVDVTGRQMDGDGLMDLAHGVPVESPLAAGATLLALVDAFRRGEPVRDDETLIVLHRPRFIDAR